MHPQDGNEPIEIPRTGGLNMFIRGDDLKIALFSIIIIYGPVEDRLDYVYAALRMGSPS